jgi:small subunit ribosomal protein S27Ae
MAEKTKVKGKTAEKEKPEKPAAEKPKAEKATEKPAEAPAEKPKEKEKKAAKVKKKERATFTRYKIEEEGLTRLRPYCERCGSGYFMADHGDRFSCGHCGFTRYKRAQT